VPTALDDTLRKTDSNVADLTATVVRLRDDAGFNGKYATLQYEFFYRQLSTHSVHTTFESLGPHFAAIHRSGIDVIPDHPDPIDIIRSDTHLLLDALEVFLTGANAEQLQLAVGLRDELRRTPRERCS
jgi:hypothetical protein